MIRLAADENFNLLIVDGLRLQRPGLDLVRVQDAGLSRARDPVVLEWAARQGRVLLTQDAATMTTFAWSRVERGQPMPGVLVVSQALAIGSAIDAIVFVIDHSQEDEWADQVEYLPL